MLCVALASVGVGDTVILSDLLTCPEMLPCSHWMRSQALDCVGGKAEFSSL